MWLQYACQTLATCVCNDLGCEWGPGRWRNYCGGTPGGGDRRSSRQQNQLITACLHFWRAEIPDQLVLPDFIYDNLIGLARLGHVELDGLVDVAVLLLDFFVIGHQLDR